MKLCVEWSNFRVIFFLEHDSYHFFIIFYDFLWYDIIWYDMIWYDIIWYDIIWYDIIWYDSRGCAAAETGSTNGKPNFFQEFWLWKMTLLKKIINNKILWNVSTVIRNEILYRKMVGSFSNLFSRPGLWPSNFLT